MKNTRSFGQFIFMGVIAVSGAIWLVSIYLWDFVHMYTVRNAPVVTGHIIDQKRVKQFLLRRADFTIQIDGTDTKVHAITDTSLLYKNLKDVRFHYSGDPTREVFLFEYESNPIWMVLEVGIPLLICVLLISKSIGIILAKKSLISSETSSP